MKKTYVKPMLSKESFDLTESIATGCGNPNGVNATMTTPENCTWTINSMTYFLESNAACMPDAGGLGEPDSDMFCYNGMTGGMPVFRS